MNKLIIKIFILLFIALTNNIIGGDLDFGYSNSNGNFIFNLSNSLPFNYKTIKITPYQRYVSNKDKYLLNLNLDFKEYFHNKFDIFFNIDYLTDKILEINNKIEYKIGFGYELFNQYDHRHKVSYGYLVREDNFFDRNYEFNSLHDLRYKHTYKSNLLSSKTVFDYILPTNEIKLLFSIDFKLFKAVMLNFSHNLSSKDDNVNYLSTAGIKIKY